MQSILRDAKRCFNQTHQLVMNRYQQKDDKLVSTQAKFIAELFAKGHIFHLILVKLMKFNLELTCFLLIVTLISFALHVNAQSFFFLKSNEDYVIF